MLPKNVMIIHIFGVLIFLNQAAWVREWKSLSRVWLFETPWTVAGQAPLSMGFTRQEYWTGSEDLPNPGTEPRSVSLQADSLPSELPGQAALVISLTLMF